MAPVYTPPRRSGPLRSVQAAGEPMFRLCLTSRGGCGTARSGSPGVSRLPERCGVVRERWGVWCASAALILGALAQGGGAAAEDAVGEAADCSAWRPAGAPLDRIEVRVCAGAGAASPGEGAGAAGAAGAAGDKAEGEDEGDEGDGAEAEAEAEGDEGAEAGEGEPTEAAAVGAAFRIEARSGYEEPRKIRVELGSAGSAGGAAGAGGAVETLEATVPKGVSRVGACGACRATADAGKLRVVDADKEEPVRPVAGNHHMQVLARDLRLSDANAERLRRIAERYHKATRKRLVVTGGTRPPQRQAELMFAKLARGEDVVALYENKPAAVEIRNAYRAAAAASLPRKRTIRALKDVIDAQGARGVYVSKHLRSGAVDVRSWDMTPAMEQALKEAIKAEPGVSLMDERKSGEPHFHLSFH